LDLNIKTGDYRRAPNRNKKDDELRQTETSLEENIRTLQIATQKVIILEQRRSEQLN
jgi:hypothetical protein